MVSRLESEKATALASAPLQSPAGMPSQVVTSRLDQRVESLQKSNVELTAHARELNSQRLQLTSQLEEASRIIRNHLPFVDSSMSVLPRFLIIFVYLLLFVNISSVGDRDLNELNVPHHDRGQQALVLRTVNSASSHVEDIASALEAYHTHTRSRLLQVHSSLSPLNSKVCNVCM